MHIECRIISQSVAPVNVIEERLVARTEQDIMVLYTRPDAIRGEMNDKQGRGKTFSAKAVLRLRGRRMIQHLVSTHHVRIRRDRIKEPTPYCASSQLVCIVSFVFDLLDRIAKLD